MNKECPNHLDPLAKVVRHMPKPIPSLFLAPYIEREHERDEHRPLKECPNRSDPLAWDLPEGPKGPQKGAQRAPNSNTYFRITKARQSYGKLKYPAILSHFNNPFKYEMYIISWYKVFARMKLKPH